MSNEAVKNNVVQKKKFRPEIEGLRAVAALLVAIYHIWLGKVSGGVDVFFVVSGFLITTSLLSKYARNKTINFFDFIFGLLRRLLPAAMFVLLATLVLSYFFLPEVRWVQTIKEIFASALYYENWQLAITATDYLDSANEKSPVQHFWAMSIQGQFYIIWFFIFMFAIGLNKTIKLKFRAALTMILVALFVISLGYSVYLTNVNQPWAYFDTRTRVWEFALGGLLCLTLTKIKLPKVVAGIIGWFGLIMLVLCGLLLNVSAMFPGYIALWPTLAAVCILVSGENASGFGVEKFLGSKWMVKLGGISYGFYLWHWVILTFYHVIRDTKHVSLKAGLAIIVLSLIMAWLTTYIVEKPLRSLKFSNKSWQTAVLIVLLVSPVLLLNGGWKFKVDQSLAAQEKLVGSHDYPGAQVFDMKDFEEKPYIPKDENIPMDKAEVFVDGCHTGKDDPKVKMCEYGKTKDYDYTVAIVGGSHAAHWHSGLLKVANNNNIRLVNVTKSGCRLSTGGEGLPSCDEWNRNIVEEIAELNPDLVFATAEISYFNVKEVPKGYIEQFEALGDHDIEVFGVRDTPYFRVSVPECIQKYGRDDVKCTIKKDEVVPKETDWSKLKNPPENVHFFDYTDKICPDERCQPVIGNVVGYYDKGHMSKTFNETLAPYIERDIMPLLKDIKKRRSE